MIFARARQGRQWEERVAANDRNAVLTRVGKGTPMGKYMRFFWHAITPDVNLRDEPMRVRLLGEDLVLYRETGGKLGLVPERCPHRGASLACGMVEKDGLVCAYHGWKFDLTGQCVDTPAEPADSKLKERIKIASYPVQELGGLIWAYLGELPAPLLPRYEYLVGEEFDRDVAYRSCRATGCKSPKTTWTPTTSNTFISATRTTFTPSSASL